MRNKLVFGLGGAILLVMSVLAALAWTPGPAVDVVISGSSEGE